MRAHLLSAFALAVLAAPAVADSKSYCEIYAKDFASAKTSDVDEWQLTYRGSYDDCMIQYGAPTAAAVESPKPVEKKKVVAPKKVATIKPVEAVVEKPAKRVEIEEGTDEWNAYCANKYASFNKDTGTYKSFTGKERRCIVTP